MVYWCEVQAWTENLAKNLAQFLYGLLGCLDSLPFLMSSSAARRLFPFYLSLFLFLVPHTYPLSLLACRLFQLPLFGDFLRYLLFTYTLFRFRFLFDPSPPLPPGTLSFPVRPVSVSLLLPPSPPSPAPPWSPFGRGRGQRSVRDWAARRSRLGSPRVTRLNGRAAAAAAAAAPPPPPPPPRR